ncbi:MAG: SLC13 family permease [Candidatus Muirbacterium halophilum]|nr:SLC13 family permease [Candidatus Muirbacterium halophilum]MCK9475914.1 SLC13 family permease [Candidatus Muirbacterium halophilum]
MIEIKNLTIIFFTFLTVYFSIKPKKTRIISLNMVSISIISILSLYITKVINIDIIYLGIFGNGFFRPIKIIIIFFTTAYSSISTDITGIFDFFAYRIVRYSKGNGKTLFLYFYIFSIILTIFTSNDIVILTLTPIIFYLGKHAHINIIPLLFAEFFGANTSSMLLYIGNPTNIIVANTAGIKFNEYFANMLIPTIIAIISNFILLYIYFRKTFTRKYEINHNSTYIIKNKYDAVISLILIFLMLIALILSENFNIKIYIITLFFSILFVIEDIIFAIYYKICHYTEKRYKSSTIRFFKTVIPKEKNDFLISIGRIPWKILPFLLSIFIMIKALEINGFITDTAILLSTLIKGKFSASIIIATVSAILANLINNQPMTIFMSSVVKNSFFTNQSEIRQISNYSIIIASNLGANLTLIGALAGIMWSQIIQKKGLEITYITFLKAGFFITPITIFLSIIGL